MPDDPPPNEVEETEESQGPYEDVPLTTDGDNSETPSQIQSETDEARREAEFFGSDEPVGQKSSLKSTSNLTSDQGDTNKDLIGNSVVRNSIEKSRVDIKSSNQQLFPHVASACFLADVLKERDLEIRALQSQIGKQDRLLAGLANRSVAFPKIQHQQQGVIAVTSDQKSPAASSSASIDNTLSSAPRGLDNISTETGVGASGVRKKNSPIAGPLSVAGDRDANLSTSPSESHGIPGGASTEAQTLKGSREDVNLIPEDDKLSSKSFNTDDKTFTYPPVLFPTNLPPRITAEQLDPTRKDRPISYFDVFQREKRLGASNNMAAAASMSPFDINNQAALSKNTNVSSPVSDDFSNEFLSGSFSNPGAQGAHRVGFRAQSSTSFLPSSTGDNQGDNMNILAQGSPPPPKGANTVASSPSDDGMNFETGRNSGIVSTFRNIFKVI